MRSGPPESGLNAPDHKKPRLSGLLGAGAPHVGAGFQSRVRDLPDARNMQDRPPTFKGVNMKRSGLCVLLALSACAPQNASKPAEPVKAPETGRFTVVFSPRAEKNTFLVDTVTGFTWRAVLISSESDKLVWEPVFRVDRPAKQMAGENIFSQFDGEKPLPKK